MNFWKLRVIFATLILGRNRQALDGMFLHCQLLRNGYSLDQILDDVWDMEEA